MAESERLICDAWMESMAVPGHIHTCNGLHDAADHFCAVCSRFWYQKKEKDDGNEAEQEERSSGS